LRAAGISLRLRHQDAGWQQAVKSISKGVAFSNRPNCRPLLRRTAEYQKDLRQKGPPHRAGGPRWHFAASRVRNRFPAHHPQHHG
jgi:hypothetical protein